MSWLTRLSILALFIAAASTFWWLDTTREPEQVSTPSAAAAELPDYYFLGFRIARYTATGLPRQVLHGERLDHYPITSSAELRQPRVIHRPVNAPLWRIRSDNGTLLEASDIVKLHGNVRLHRPGTGTVRTFTLLTDRLSYAMRPEIARTEQPVRMHAPGTRVDAIGMTARLARGEVDLLDEVRVKHDPGLADGNATDGY